MHQRAVLSHKHGRIRQPAPAWLIHEARLLHRRQLASRHSAHGHAQHRLSVRRLAAICVNRPPARCTHGSMPTQRRASGQLQMR
nr:MAG TPA: hypothetical protein [Caudoviricetes sp.]